MPSISPSHPSDSALIRRVSRSASISFRHAREQPGVYLEDRTAQAGLTEMILMLRGGHGDQFVPSTSFARCSIRRAAG